MSADKQKKIIEMHWNFINKIYNSDIVYM